MTDEAGHRWFYVVVVDITDSENLKNQLVSQNADLKNFIDSMPARIIVYKNENGVTSLLGVNGYMQHIASQAKKDTAEKRGKMLLSFVHPSDVQHVHQFFQDVFSHDNEILSTTYRITLDEGRSYRWYNCDILSIPQKDGTKIAYGIYTDFTRQKEQEIEFNTTIQGLLTATPDMLFAYRVNITQDKIVDLRTFSDYFAQEFSFNNVEEMFALGNRVFEAAKNPTRLSHDFFINSFKKGKESITLTYRRKVGTQIHWVRAYYRIMKNPTNNDIEVIVYGVDIDRQYKKESITNILAGMEYDTIGIIDTQTQKIDYFYPDNATDLPEDCDGWVQRIMAEGGSASERQMYQKALNFERVVSMLSKQTTYVFAFTLKDARKQLTFCYLGNDKLEIIFVISDVTVAFKRERRIANKLKTALKAAEDANELKTSFLGNVSHDIRTPLNAILGYNALALATPGLPKEAIDYMQKIATAGTTLLSLINDTLDLQRIETGNVQINSSPRSCLTVATEIINNIQPLMDQKHHHFIINKQKADEIYIDIDINRIKTIFINLLSNAAKFTPDGGTIEFLMENLKVENHRLYTKTIVKDNGVGMSAAFLNRIYEPFSQERDEKTRNIEGSGLGLSIVKKTVDLLGGTIEVKSKLGEGTTFVVYLDFECVDTLPGAQTETADKPASIKGLHLLLAEDNAMNIELTTKMIEKNGATVEVAHDGIEAVQMFTNAKAGHFDAILMDIRMPRLDGRSACRVIRQLPRKDARNIPIIALSADAYYSDIEASLRCGMNAHISKPLVMADMVNAVSKYVKH